MSNTEGLVDHLRRSALAQDLNEDECQVLATAMQTRTIQKGEYLLRQGQRGDTLYLIVSGRAAVTKQTEGSPITLHIMGPGSVAGEMGFVDHLAHTVGLVALEPVTALVMSSEAFEGLMPEHPELVYHVLRAIVHLEHLTLQHMNRQFVEMHNYITKTHGRY